MSIISQLIAGIYRSASISSTPIFDIAVDPLWTNVHLLAHFEGDAGSTSFLDESSYNREITSVGGAVLSTVSPLVQNSSVLLDAPSEYLTVLLPEVYPGSGSWCFEWSCNQASVNQDFCYLAMNNPTTGASLYLNKYQGILYLGDNVNNVIAAAFPSDIVANKTYHMALSFDGTTYRFFVDGIIRMSTTTKMTTTRFGTELILGNRPGFNLNFNGKMDDVRVTLGHPRYTSQYLTHSPIGTVIPAETTDSYASLVSLLLHGNGTHGSTIIVDSSGAPKTVTATNSAKISTDQSRFGGASLSFAGGFNSHVSVPDTGKLQMGAGDFTIEFWKYHTSLSSYQTIYDKGYTAAGSLLLQTALNTGLINVYAGGSMVLTESAGLVAGIQYHYALIRKGTILKLFRNGTEVGSGTSAVNFNNVSPTYIGGTPSGGGAYTLNGYLDDFRITKGVARYTGSFAPPEQPFADPPAPVGISARFWRLYFAQSGFVSCSEVEFREAASGSTGVNQTCTGGTPFANQYYAPEGLNPARAFNGILSETGWASNGSPPATLGYDFGIGNQRIVTEVAIGGRPSALSQSPSSVTIQYSNDGITYTDALVVPVITGWTANEMKVFTLPSV